MPRSKGLFVMWVKVDEVLWDTARWFRAATKDALKVALRHWKDTFYDLHFTEAAYFRYPGVYQRRRVSNRPGGAKDQRPLYKTGFTKALGRATMKISGATKVAGVKLNAVSAKAQWAVPSYVRLMEQHGFDPLMELTVVNAEEVRVLSKIVSQEIAKKLRNHPRRMKRLNTRVSLGAGLGTLAAKLAA